MTPFVGGFLLTGAFFSLEIPEKSCKEVKVLTTLHTMASGSSGNALVLSCGDTHVLVDAGISCRRITTSLRELGLTPEDLSGLLITHTHSDHIGGLQTLLKHSHFPLYATVQAGRELCCRLPLAENRLRNVTPLSPFAVGDCTVTAFSISHDAPGACGYRLDTGDGSVGILTDTGYVTDEAEKVLPGVDLAILEANHDVETLRSGPYPYTLKQRILGPQGHLSNEDAGAFAAQLARSGTSEIVLAHLSRENNTPAQAYNAVERSLQTVKSHPTALSVAPRDHLSEAHVLGRRAVCRK